MRVWRTFVLRICVREVGASLSLNVHCLVLVAVITLDFGVVCGVEGGDSKVCV